jgi:predicted NBD/HSP70 family sugar kinase
MREMNRALLLELLRHTGPITRSDLARRSALAKPTVSEIVDVLIREGAVREAGPGPSSARGGPRGRLVALDPTAAAFAGIHLGVGQTTLAVADALGEIRTTKTLPSFGQEPGRALCELPGITLTLMRDAQLPRTRLRGVGVAVPGLVDHATGACVLAPNLRWRDVPLRAHLASALGVPVHVRNSMQAGAIAELRLGSNNVRSFAWVYVGSGIGAAVVIDSHVFYGRRGYTGELGHWKVVEEGVLCGCGRRGCLETVASTCAIELAARTAIEAQRLPRSVADVRSVAQAAAQGDSVAREILVVAGEHLGVAVSSLLNLLDLEAVVFDGPVIRASDTLIETIRRSVSRHTLDDGGISVLTSTVGGDVMLKGAVFLALEGDMADRVVVRGGHAGADGRPGAAIDPEAPGSR